MATVTDDVLSLVTGGREAFTVSTQASTPPVQAPTDYTGLVSAAEQKYDIPAGLLSRVIFQGERSGATAVSPKGAVGLGQLMPATAREMGVTDPTDPAQNIDGAARYLRQQLDTHGGDQALAVASYNAGPGTVAKYGGIPPYKETHAYVQRVTGEQPSVAQSAGNADILSLVTGGKQNLAVPNPMPKQMDPNAPQSSAEFANNANLAYRSIGKIGDAPVEAQGFQPNPDQAKTLRQMDAAGMIDRNTAALGTAKQPYVIQSADGDASSLGPGVYYLDWNGKLQQTPGKPVGVGEGLGMGALQGVADDGASVVQGKNAIGNALITGQLMPSDMRMMGIALTAPDILVKRMGLQNSQDMIAREQIARNLYDARYGHNGYANAGRIGGNIAASAPIIASGEEGLGAVAEGQPIINYLVGKGGSNLLARAGSLASKGALEGAETAGLTSSASDQPLPNQLLAGAAAGGLLTPLAAGGAGVAKRLRSAASEAFGQTADALGNRSPSTFTPRQLAQADKNALVYVRDLVDRAPTNALIDNAAEAAGKPVTGAEALGRNAQRQLAVVARRSGDAGDKVESYMRQRQQAMPERVLQDLSSATGADPSAIAGDFVTQNADLRAQAKPLYEKAYAVGGVNSDVLQSLMGRPAMQSAMQRAVGIAAEEGRDPSELGFIVKEMPTGQRMETRTVTQAVPSGGTRDVQVQVPVSGATQSQLVQVQNPTAQTWDYVKRGLDDVINSNRNPLTGKLTLDEKGRAQLGTLNALRSELINQNPAYGDALAAGGEPLRLEDAYNNAPKLMGNNVPMATFASKFNALSPSEQQAHLGGFVNDVYQRVASGKLKLRDMQTPLFQQKAELMLGPDRADQLIQNVTHEADLARTGARINPNANSPTMELTEANKDQGDMLNTIGGAAVRLAKGKPLEAAAHVLSAPFVGAWNGAQAPINEATRNAVANLLMMPPSELNQRLLAARALQQQGLNPRLTNALNLALPITAAASTNRLIGNSQ